MASLLHMCSIELQAGILLAFAGLGSVVLALLSGFRAAKAVQVLALYGEARLLNSGAT